MRGMAPARRGFPAAGAPDPVSMQNCHAGCWPAWRNTPSTWAVLADRQPVSSTSALRCRSCSPGASPATPAPATPRASRRGRRTALSHVASQSHTDGQAHSIPKVWPLQTALPLHTLQGQSSPKAILSSDGQSVGSNHVAVSRRKAGTWAGRCGVPGVASVNGGYNASSSESQGTFAFTTQHGHRMGRRSPTR